MDAPSIIRGSVYSVSDWVLEGPLARRYNHAAHMKRDGRYAFLVRCTEEQRSLIREAASLERRTMSAYVVNICMDRINAEKTRAQRRKPEKNRFGNYLYELRFDAGLTLRDLKMATGIPLARLWAYEHGASSPNLEALAALSRAFRMPLHRLLKRVA